MQDGPQAFHKIITILVVIEDLAALDATGDDMVQGPRGV
jgi:hypothetical protein